MAIEEISIEELAARLESDAPLSRVERLACAALLRKMMRPNAGRKRKWKSQKEKDDFHNARKKAKRRAEPEEI